MQSYLEYVKPILDARVDGSQLSVTVPPCPAFYSEACWGGVGTWLDDFYRNVSAACARSDGQQPCAWQQVTAHHYRPRVSIMNCEVLADGVPCSYRSETIGAPLAPGLVDELAGQGESEDVHGAATDQHGEAIFETRFQWMHSDEAEWIGGGDGARTWCGGGRVIAPGQLQSLAGTQQDVPACRIGSGRRRNRDSRGVGWQYQFETTRKDPGNGQVDETTTR